jgi:4-hydroxybenzoate polyprenyltransferase
MIRSFQTFARDIKLSHSIFALPFALLAMFLAAGSMTRLPTWIEALLILWCMFTARTFAMATNRWADRKLDAANPRTAGRAIPSGQLSPWFVFLMMILCAIGFVAGCAGFIPNLNPWPLVLSPLVLFWLAFYSFAKRFTWLCHVILGIALAISPLAAAIAIEPAYLKEAPVYLLVLMVATWVAGFDIIYALQDVEVDRQSGLYSMPSRLGERKALWISRGLHVVSLIALVSLWNLERQLGLLFFIGVVIVAGLLILEHALVWGSKTGRINMAFFTVNGVISLLLGLLGIIDVLMAR